MTVLGTRPELIRTSSLTRLIDENATQFVIHTGQNASPGLNDIFFNELNIREPDLRLEPNFKTFGSFVSEIFPKVETEIRRFEPEAFVVLGDTNSALTALLAKKLGVAVYHLEAGNRSFDPNVPEELNRRLVDQIADVNLPYSEFARQNLIREGFNPRFIFKSGSPMNEVISNFQGKFASSSVLERLNLKPDSYFVVSLHRQENINQMSRLRSALDALDDLRRATGKKVVVSCHPRLSSQLKFVKELNDDWITEEPFGFFDYMNLQINSHCVISDSGSVSEEASLLGFSAVTLRDSMERQEALELGVVTMSGLTSESLKEAVHFAVRSSPQEIPTDYKGSDFSHRVWSVISSTARLIPMWTGFRGLDPIDQ
ncbi:UDP-N-acetyl glucosamine 2-epimerase [Aquiluna sp.]|nr:UDP-N-acetyl glucosamine 2-epimerase [Aquiluna sp.]